MEPQSGFKAAQGIRMAASLLKNHATVNKQVVGIRYLLEPNIDNLASQIIAPLVIKTDSAEIKVMVFAVRLELNGVSQSLDRFPCVPDSLFCPTE
jgi:hypothetical protein